METIGMPYYYDRRNAGQGAIASPLSREAMCALNVKLRLTTAGYM